MSLQDAESSLLVRDEPQTDQDRRTTGDSGNGRVRRYNRPYGREHSASLSPDLLAQAIVTTVVGALLTWLLSEVTSLPTAVRVSLGIAAAGIPFGIFQRSRFPAHGQ